MSLGGKDRSPKEFCSIMKYLESEDSELAEAIESQCMQSNLVPRRGDGVTFLRPTGAYRKKLIDAAYDDADMFVENIRGLTLHGAYHRPADLKGALVNHLQREFSMTGLKVVEDKKFKARSDRAENTAVLLLESGEPKLDGKEAKPERSTGKAKKTVGGGHDEHKHSLRYSMARSVENRYWKARTTNGSCPYLDKVSSFMNYLLNLEDKSLFYKLLGLMHYEPMLSFYLVFEPYKSVGSYLVDTEVLEAWMAVKYVHQPVTTMLEVLSHTKDSEYGVECSKAAEAVNSLRNKGLTERTDKASLPKYVCATYDAVSSGRVNGVSLFNSELASVYGANKCMKQWQDELAFCIQMHLDSMEDEGDYKSLCHTIRHNYPGNNYEKEIMIKPQTFSGLLNPVELFFCLVFGLVRSSFFVHVTRDPNCVRNSAGSAPSSMCKPDDPNLVNYDKFSLEKLEKLPNPSVNVESVRAMVDALRMHGVAL